MESSRSYVIKLQSLVFTKLYFENDLSLEQIVTGFVTNSVNIRKKLVKLLEDYLFNK